VTLQAEPAATLEAATQAIIDLVQAEAGAVELTPDSAFEELAVDSVKVMSIVFKIEACFDIQLDEADADDLRTIGDLAFLVVRRIEELG
jgi:acyl carrier protein